MSQSELLIAIANALDGAGVPFMLTGSLVSSLQGEPRATHDIDLVIALTPDSVERLVAALSATSGYFSRQAMEDAMSRSGMFKVHGRAACVRAEQARPGPGVSRQMGRVTRCRRRAGADPPGSPGDLTRPGAPPLRSPTRPDRNRPRLTPARQRPPGHARSTLPTTTRPSDTATPTRSGVDSCSARSPADRDRSRR